MLNVAINGAQGRMGQELLSIISKSNIFQLSFAKSQQSASGIIDKLPEQTSAQIIIDFSNPDSTIELLSWCIERKIALVIGTTGFNSDQLQLIKESSKLIPILLSPNMSLSVNVLFKVAQIVAKSLADSEVEIIESHHRYKKDAPSGTALRIGEAIAFARGDDFNKVVKLNRTGTENEVRKQNEIGFSVIRGGNIIGKHTAMFLTACEELSLTSEITDRACFASGALRAAQFIATKEAGLYSMEDVLGLNNL